MLTLVQHCLRDHRDSAVVHHSCLGSSSGPGLALLSPLMGFKLIGSIGLCGVSVSCCYLSHNGKQLASSNRLIPESPPHRFSAFSRCCQCWDGDLGLKNAMPTSINNKIILLRSLSHSVSVLSHTGISTQSGYGGVPIRVCVGHVHERPPQAEQDARLQLPCGSRIGTRAWEGQ